MDSFEVLSCRDSLSVFTATSGVVRQAYIYC